MNDIISSAIRIIRDMALAEKPNLSQRVKCYDNEEYFIGPDGLPVQIQPPVVAKFLTLELGSLTGIVDCIKHGVHGFAPAALGVLIANPQQVNVITKEPEGIRRVTHILAAARTEGNAGITIERKPVEDTIIALKSFFVPNEDLRELVSLLAHIIVDSHSVLEDDGVTQMVTAKAGISTRKNAQVKETYKLKPFYGFGEVERQERDYFVRLTKVGEQAVAVTVRPNHDPAYESRMIEATYQFLRKNLPEETVVLR